MSEESGRTQQLELLREEVRRRPRPKARDGVAPDLAVARVAVDLPLAHLDRPFDYLVPETMHDDAVPGCRVKVRFAGRDVDGFLVERRSDTEHVGRLAPLRRVVSAEPVLAPEILALARMVADRYAGTLADVLRLAVPPRHARAERAAAASPATLEVDPTSLRRRWSDEPGAPAFLDRLAGGGHPRAVWQAAAGADWPTRYAAAALACAGGGRGSLVCVPDARDAARVSAALTELAGADSHVVLTADLGPEARYRAFLKVSRGTTRIVVGTRAAAFAPVHDLGLVALWDDGDDLYAEPRAPYPHTREVLTLRSYSQHTAMLLGGYATSVEAAALLESGWAAPLAASRDRLRAAAPQVHVTGESDLDLVRDAAGAAARMPRRVFETVREALQHGPVLVHTPRAGYQPVLGCAQCRQPARCGQCTGPLRRDRAATAPVCGRCGLSAEEWRCPHCGHDRLRAPVVGTLRTAEEWGRSFASTSVVTSGGDHVIDEIGAEAAIVIATPGAEPRATGGYAAAVLLDTWLTLARPGMRATEEALRRWTNAAALVRPGGDGGRVVVVGEPSLAVVQALVRWDPTGFARRELAERTSARLTPAYRMATLTAPPDVLAQAVESLELPHDVELLGPVPSGEEARLVARVDRRHGAALSRALQHLQAGRSSRKLPVVRVQVDPVELV